jgi:hypothetical protein
VIAAYVEGAVDAGLPKPAEELRGRVGKQANRLLTQKTPLEVLITAARHAGAVGWNDLAVQIQRDAAPANGTNPSGHQSYRNPTDQSAYDTEELRPS